jgi:hypothetical protein
MVRGAKHRESFALRNRAQRARQSLKAKTKKLPNTDSILVTHFQGKNVF